MNDRYLHIKYKCEHLKSKASRKEFVTGRRTIFNLSCLLQYTFQTLPSLSVPGAQSSQFAFTSTAYTDMHRCSRYVLLVVICDIKQRANICKRAEHLNALNPRSLLKARGSSNNERTRALFGPALAGARGCSWCSWVLCT
jgi:hypothetical protein